MTNKRKVLAAAVLTTTAATMTACKTPETMNPNRFFTPTGAPAVKVIQCEDRSPFDIDPPTRLDCVYNADAGLTITFMQNDCDTSGGELIYYPPNFKSDRAGKFYCEGMDY